jgi:quercetin dioxygenase-like cupin family protein
MTTPNPLPQLKRYITAHDSNAKAIFSDALPEDNTFTSLPNGEASFALGYTTKGFPVDLNAEKDLQLYKSNLETPPGLVVSGGTVLRFVDVKPGHVSPMHRTVSLDYGVVLEGDMELILDSGETKRMTRGDVAVQRGTMHQWRNNSQTEWARMMYVLQESRPVEVGGKTLGEDYGDMSGVPKSS